MKTDMDKNRIICHLCGMFVVLVWGTTFLVSKMLLEILTPVQIIVMRFLLAYIMLWVLCPQWKVKWKDELGFLTMALFGNTIYYMLENSALMYTYSANVSILVSAAPLTTVLLALVSDKIFFLRQNRSGGIQCTVEDASTQKTSEFLAAREAAEQMNNKRLQCKEWLGMLIAFAGMVFVVFNGTFVLKLSPKGDILSLCAALCWGVYSVILEQFMTRFSSLFISRKLMLYGFLTSMPIMLLQGKAFPLGDILQTKYLLGILFLGMVGSGLCYICWNKACNGLGIITANMYIYAIPFITLAAGAVVYGDPITWMALVGAVLIALGMILCAGN